MANLMNFWDLYEYGKTTEKEKQDMISTIVKTETKRLIEDKIGKQNRNHKIVFKILTKQGGQ